ncbi:MAG TPA: hypothetical protein VMV55_02805 [Methanoregula sp.]|nr:hypothetical protein [Methanoregula sp.]
MLVCQRGPGDNEELENKEQEKPMKVHIANDEENQKPGTTGPGEEGTGQYSTDKGGARTTTRTTPAPRLVERVTALRGQGIARSPEPKSGRRRQTRSDINRNDPEIPYVKFEAATRDLVCSLMERQDRMKEEIFCRINDLEYRVDDLEQDRTGEGGGK